MGIAFNGPYNVDTTDFNSIPGVYVISDSSFRPIDVGQTEDLRRRMSSHDRYECWARSSTGRPLLYFYHIPNERERLELESAIRSRFPFVCGIR